jgi:predicted transglutaminase-like cysteine proteinase
LKRQPASGHVIGNSLLLAQVVIPSGEHHLVLLVRTRESDLVLDNLAENVRPIV